MNKEYISISEFAKRVGVSHQAIYKRLDKDLQPWLQVANGKKQLNIKALELFYIEKVATNSTKSATSVATESETIKALIRELEFKNREIEQLREENRRLSEKLLSLSDKVGNTLQIISQTQLADKMIESKQFIEKTTTRVDESSIFEEKNGAYKTDIKKKVWQFWKKNK